MDCLFCKIIRGEIPSNKVYEDDKVLVFLDINPNTNGHMLIIPKKHMVTIEEMDNETYTHILDIEKKMYKLLKDKLNAKGLTMCQNNDLGQEVKHFHMHLIPRYDNDNSRIIFNKDLLKDVSETFNKLTN